MAGIKDYTSKALETMEKIMNGTRPYIPNKLYKNERRNIYWYKNRQGYMQVLRPCGVHVDGKIVYYTIRDYLLDRYNMLQFKGEEGRYQTVREAIKELERKVTQ